MKNRWKWIIRDEEDWEFDDRCCWKIRVKYNKKHSFSWWWKRKDSHWMYHWMLKKLLNECPCRFHFQTAFFSYVLGTRLVTWDPAFVSVAWPEEVAKLRSNFISCSHVQHQTWILTIFKQNLSVELCPSLKTSSSWFAADVCFSSFRVMINSKEIILNKYFSFRYSSEISLRFQILHSHLHYRLLIQHIHSLGVTFIETCKIWGSFSWSFYSENG